MNVELVIATLLSSAIVASVPLMLAATGEAIGERAGILNLGIEGVMLLSGFAAFRVALVTGSLPAGILTGGVAGTAIGFTFGLLVVANRADQVLVGLGLTLGGSGLSAFLFRETFGAEQPLLDRQLGHPLQALAPHLPLIGPLLFGQTWLVYVAFALVLGIGFWLRAGLFGLRLRAAGEAPFALDAAGQSVERLRIAATTVAGAFYGLGGAALVLADLGFFRPNVTAGAGFIAIAIAMLGQLTPWRVAVAATGFGLLEGLGPALQLTDLRVAPDFLHLLPYVGVVVALLVARRQVALPAALGHPYRRGLRTDA